MQQNDTEILKEKNNYWEGIMASAIKQILTNILSVLAFAKSTKTKFAAEKWETKNQLSYKKVCRVHPIALNQLRITSNMEDFLPAMAVN